VAAQRDRRAAARAPDVAAIDTIGAGDCFDAGFVAGLVNNLPLQASLELGVLCGSLSTLDYGGGGAPTLSQLARQAPQLVPWADHHPLEGKDQR
jgi:sugar/nucleoside kinase (ribokinase family)